MKIETAAPYAAISRNTQGEYQNLYRKKIFEDSQRTQGRLRKIASAPQCPQKIHPLTYLFIGYFLGASSVPQRSRFLPAGANTTHDNPLSINDVSLSGQSVSRSHTDTSFAHQDISLQKDVRSGRMVRSAKMERTGRTEMESLGRHIIPIRSEERPAAWSKFNLEPTCIIDDIKNRELLESANQRVMILLHENADVIPDVKISPHTMIMASIIFISLNEQSQAALARYLQKSTGNYGANREEVMSVTMQRKIIRDWIALNLFGTSIEALIEKKVLDSQLAGHLRSKDLNDYLLSAAFRSGVIDDKFRPWILMQVLIEEVPMIGFFETHPAVTDPDCERLAQMKLHDFEWGQIHAGLRFSQLIGLGIDLGKR